MTMKTANTQLLIAGLMFILVLASSANAQILRSDEARGLAREIVESWGLSINGTPKQAEIFSLPSDGSRWQVDGEAFLSGRGKALLAWKFSEILPEGNSTLRLPTDHSSDISELWNYGVGYNSQYGHQINTDKNMRRMYIETEEKIDTQEAAFTHAKSLLKGFNDPKADPSAVERFRTVAEQMGTWEVLPVEGSQTYLILFRNMPSPQAQAPNKQQESQPEKYITADDSSQGEEKKEVKMVQNKDGVWVPDRPSPPIDRSKVRRITPPGHNMSESAVIENNHTGKLEQKNQTENSGNSTQKMADNKNTTTIKTPTNLSKGTESLSKSENTPQSPNLFTKSYRTVLGWLKLK